MQRGTQEVGRPAHLRSRLVWLAMGLLLGVCPPSLASAESLEYPIDPAGYVFGRLASIPADGSSGRTVLGFAVTDDDGIGLWTGYQALGGRAVLGIPMSERFECGPSVCQAFEGGVLRWDAAAGTVALAPDVGVPASARTLRAMPASSAPAPTQVIIPRLGVDTSLVWLDPEPEGELPAPDEPDQVAWYTDSSRPGEGGSVILAGHVDWVGRHAVFRELDTLQPGDEIFIGDEAGGLTRYVVTEAGRYSREDPELKRSLANSGLGPSTLVLVTCGGPFDASTRTYLERTVVRATASD